MESESDSDGESDSGGGSDSEDEGGRPPKVCVLVPRTVVVTHTAEADAAYRQQLHPLGTHGAHGAAAAPGPPHVVPGDKSRASPVEVAAPSPPSALPAPSVSLEAAFRSMKAIVRDQLGVDMSARGKGHPRSHGRAPVAWTPTAGPNKGAPYELRVHGLPACFEPVAAGFVVQAIPCLGCYCTSKC
jgi:hypothetical protein